MATRFRIKKGFMHFEVIADGYVYVKAIPPFKYEDRVEEVFAKSQQLIIERILLKHPLDVDQSEVAARFFEETGWEITYVPDEASNSALSSARQDV